MRRKMKWRVLASACAAAVAVTSMPYMATQVHAEPAAVTQQTGNNDLKLWYTSPADITKYYQGWQEKSLPIGNGGIGGTVFGGITREYEEYRAFCAFAKKTFARYACGVCR